jgi:23S rRNA (guanosine2251-2'-O)-methyltransferase
MSKQFIYGIHAVKALLNQEDSSILFLYTQPTRQDKRLTEILTLAEAARIRVISKSLAELDDFSELGNHQGIVAECLIQTHYTEADLPTLLAEAPHPLLLILDGVTDPHNLGACLRSADATKVTAVIAPKDRAVGITPIVRKVASGAVETVPFITVTNLARTLRDLKEQGIWLYGLDDTARDNLYQTQLTGPLAFILGSEGEGMRRLTRELCDFLIKIPMAGSVSSLNVSVATAVCLYEALRQRTPSTH